MVKIQLDHKALAALFETQGKDFEIELSRGVLETACRKHIKAILPEEVSKTLKKVGNEFVKDEIAKEVGSYSAKVLQINPKIKERLETEMKRIVDKEISTLYGEIQKYFEECIERESESLKEYYDKKIEAILGKLVNKKINTLINNAVDERIEEMYGKDL